MQVLPEKTVKQRSHRPGQPGHKQIVSNQQPSIFIIMRIMWCKDFLRMREVLVISVLFLLQLFEAKAELTLEAISSDLKTLSESFRATLSQDRQRRSDTISSQTVYQYQKKQKKCKNLRSYGIASGGNALRLSVKV